MLTKIERILKLGNLEYWRQITDSIIPDEEKLVEDVSSRHIEDDIADSFEKAIALIMVDSQEDGFKFLRKCQFLLSKKGSNGRDSMFYLYSLLLQWLHNNELNQVTLQKLITAKWQEIHKDIMQYGVRDILNICIECSSGRIQKDPNIENLNFKKVANEKYPYEAIADQLIEVTQYLLLKGHFRAARNALDASQKLYSKALRIIPIMLTRRNHRWKKLRDKSDIEIRTNNPDGKYDYYLEQREALRGNIPLFRWQGEVLLHLQWYMGHGFKLEEAKKKFHDFFTRVINPPGSLSTALCLTEEIIWIFLKQKFEKLYLKSEFQESHIQYLINNLK